MVRHQYTNSRPDQCCRLFRGTGLVSVASVLDHPPDPQSSRSQGVGKNRTGTSCTTELQQMETKQSILKHITKMKNKNEKIRPPGGTHSLTHGGSPRFLSPKGPRKPALARTPRSGASARLLGARGVQELQGAGLAVLQTALLRHEGHQKPQRLLKRRDVSRKRRLHVVRAFFLLR